MKLSHSSISRYQSCAKSYELHYIKKVRPTTTTAALLFGDALDSSLNCLLLDEGDAYEKFMSKFTYVDINKNKEYLPTSEKVVYANADYDADLLFDNVHQDACKEIEGAEELNYDDIKAEKDRIGFDRLPTIKKRYFNYFNWRCLCEKAKYILEGYKLKILPKIVKVISLQEKVEIKNDSDEFVGFIDMVAELKDHGVVILDHKTSARDYEEDSVISSAQLSSYLYFTGEKYNTTKAGFIVMKKAMKKKKVCISCGHNGEGSRAQTCDSKTSEGKRCGGEWKKTPYAEFQLLVDEIPNKRQELVIDNLDEINKCIKANLFPRNLNTCDNFFGGKCPYYSYCYTGSMKGLEKKEE